MALPPLLTSSPRPTGMTSGRPGAAARGLAPQARPEQLMGCLRSMLKQNFNLASINYVVIPRCGDDRRCWYDNAAQLTYTDNGAEGRLALDTCWAARMGVHRI